MTAGYFTRPSSQSPSGSAPLLARLAQLRVGQSRRGLAGRIGDIGVTATEARDAARPAIPRGLVPADALPARAGVSVRSGGAVVRARPTRGVVVQICFATVAPRGVHVPVAVAEPGPAGVGALAQGARGDRIGGLTNAAVVPTRAAVGQGRDVGLADAVAIAVAETRRARTPVEVCVIVAVVRAAIGVRAAGASDGATAPGDRGANICERQRRAPSLLPS